MAEVIGLIASLVTMATLVNEGIKRAKLLYQAADELKTEQIEDLTNLLHEIDRQPTASLSATISTSLLRAKLTLEQLDQIVKIKLLRNAEGGSRARHRAWVRNKSKVCKIQKALKEHRLNLIAAMGVTNLETTPLVGQASLPNSLSIKVKQLLQAEDLDENGEFHLSLTGENSLYRQNYRSSPNSSFTTARSSSTGFNVLGFLDDLGCPRFYEKEVTQVELLDPPRSFVSCIGGKLVYEVKFVNSGPSCELLYSIRVLHCMKGRAGFTKLIGITVDNGGRRLKSYLIELPRARFSLLRTLGDPAIQWDLRESWAKQLVEGISELHSKGFVVGTLFSGRSPVVLDESNTLNFWYLKKLPESVPSYYREIVNACRAQDPNARPAARRLLERFPPTSETVFTNREPDDPKSTDLAVIGGSLIGTVNCDKCRSRYLQLPFFHCNICETGDFDLCWACYEKGVHCYNVGHSLVEMRKVAGLIVPASYHSSVKDSGKREILEL
ncbi:MAG: hypothetical protein Q9195_006803 [Heterodermia aff. obscurata]